MWPAIKEWKFNKFMLHDFMVVKLAKKSYVFKKQRKSLKGKQMEILGRRFECTL